MTEPQPAPVAAAAPPGGPPPPTPPTPAAPAPAPPVPSPEFEGPARWVDATKEVRKTASNLTTVIGAAAGVIFGAGPVLARIDLDPTAWSSGRILTCLLGALVGISGVVLVISALVGAQTPIELTLSSLPKGFTDLVNQNPTDYLPVGCTSIDDFSTKLRAFRTAAAKLPYQIEHETDPTKKAALQAALEPIKTNAKTYSDRRSELLAQGGYFAASRTLSDQQQPIAAGAILAVLGATVYLLAISGKPADDPEPGPSTELATLVPHHDGGSEEYLETLGIESCVDHQRDPAGIAVLLHGGQGSPEDPWSVETVGGRHCPRRSFTAIRDVIELVQDEADEVTVHFESGEDD